MEAKPQRESRSVRLSENEWATAETIAVMCGAEGAGAGLRAALHMASVRIIEEGDGEYGTYLCPASGDGDHVFVWANGDGTEEPPVGERVLCCGGDGYFCGYSFTWRGEQVFNRLLREFQDRRSAKTSSGER